MFYKKPDTSGMRHEIKLLLSYAEYISLAEKLKPLTIPDSNSTVGGDYFIRSLYLDDIRNTAYETKMAGIDDRKKYRIRCYNGSKDVIKFECKYKKNNRIKKISFNISYNQYCNFQNGSYDFLYTIKHPLAAEILGQITSNGLSPSVIVDYDREAYLYPVSNTRLTFDKNLRAGIGSFDIYNDNLYTLPIFQNGSVIFEIKYDKFIPAHIVDVISSARSTKMSLSKYCMCRQKSMEVNYYEY